MGSADSIDSRRETKALRLIEFVRRPSRVRSQSARGLAQSKTWAGGNWRQLLECGDGVFGVAAFDCEDTF